MVRGALATAMAGSAEFFGLGSEVRRARSLDWLDPAAALRPLEAGSQQQPLADSSDGHFFSLGSRVLSLCQRRLPGDWEEAFGHGVVLLETFVDPQRHRGTVYRAANWMYVGNTRGYRRTHGGYTATPQTPKMVFLRPPRPDACQILC